MRVTISVKRGNYWQDFDYEPSGPEDTVAGALTRINASDDIRDASGNPAAPIMWECSCLQKKCGACAMVINGRPGLACDKKLSGLGSVIRLEPLRKFPLVRDLVVDRSIMRENLKKMSAWLEDRSGLSAKDEDLACTASECLQCGLCLEVCPNFAAGGKFPGMAAAVSMARLLARLPDEQKKEASSLYEKRIFEGCGKSLACRNICPAKIDIDRMLVNSNAIAVWKRYLK